MKKFITIIVLIVVCAVSVVALVGCNRDKTITVGYTVYEPMNYTESGVFKGFDTELAQKVFEELGYKVIFKEITWSQKYIDLNSGNIDCIWNGFTSNGSDDGIARSQLVDFSYNYMVNYQAVVIHNDNAAKYSDKASFKDVLGYAEGGSAGYAYAKELSGVEPSTVNKQTDAILQVNSKSGEFAVVDYLLANSIVGKGDFSNLSFLAALNSEIEYYAIGFKKGSELTAKVNELLEKYAADGSLLKIATKYGLDNAVITDFTSQKN